ncbi:ActR/PrrA/RegA family redox response regulator transcription factor [Candidatus Odyssella thessalonicensis]|uniref:ActR/PrrA/RegA family redox response regulator transcription factor n=1 Tax=Candidatus Odyssella thessalonicensis TaxID=84647 RepID=UPI000225C1AC|nr:ActR/PrrA/RegA family redox response regulator transcription factor [Candidatus Odyssella thessalonicensis]
MKTLANNASLIIIDDDQPLREQLGRVMGRRGYTVSLAGSLEEAKLILSDHSFEFAIVDMKLGDGYGLDLVNLLKAANDNMRIVMLTGYGNIATAVAAIKHGAVDYLTKPADADMIDNALRQREGSELALPEDPMSPDRVKWEHIQRVFSECGNNVSETARRLRMHRRTLQRILAKHAPRG